MKQSRLAIMRRLALFAALIALLQLPNARAEAGERGILESILSGSITYELVHTPRKHAYVTVADQSRKAFVETVRSFGRDNKFEAIVVPGPNKDQVAVQLSSDNVTLLIDNPFRDAREYTIALYQKEAGAVAAQEVEKYWGELKGRVTLVGGVGDWLEKK